MLRKYEVLRLHHLLEVCDKQRVSVRATIKRVEHAIAGTYHACGYDQRDVDLARLMRHLAGDKGTYILSKAVGMPSTMTIKRRSKAPAILPCAGPPTLEVLSRNLDMLFPVTDLENTPTFSGRVLMADGLAIERWIGWVCETNEVAGACKEHGTREQYDLKMTSFDNVATLAEAMRRDSPDIHRGSEAMVFGFAPFHAEDYHGIASLVVASCKEEKAAAMGDTLIMCCRQWQSVQASVYGPVWFVSTDGATIFRSACYEHFTTRIFEGSLHAKLSKLEGLNLACGEDNIVHCPDTKHLFKRIHKPHLISYNQHLANYPTGNGTLMRSAEGTIILSTVINRAVLSGLLNTLPDQSPEMVEALLDPIDHQNVPRAVRLLQAIAALDKLDMNKPSLGDQVKMQSVKLLAALWSSVLQAFIDPELSLSEQLTCLSRFAHLSYALHIMHGTGFMTNQLYSDMQVLVKAAYVAVTRQGLLDSKARFYLYQLGTDRLEELFAEVRTQTHDCNCTIIQLAERLSISADIIAILNTYPEWNHLARRLSFVGMDGGLDHVNPTYYKKNMVVGEVNVEKCWNDGHREAQDLLHVAGSDFDILQSLRRILGSDLMCPNGRSYPGVSSVDTDRSQPDTPLAAADVHSQDSEHASQQSLEDLFESLPTATVPCQGNAQSSPTVMDSYISTYSDSIPYDCLLVPTKGPNQWKMVYKSTMLNSIFNQGVLHTSTDRLRRVQGEAKSGSSSHGPSAGSCTNTGPTLAIKDIALVPVRTGATVAAAFVEVTGIESKGRRVMLVTEADLESEAARTVVFGQVLVIKPQTPEAICANHTIAQEEFGSSRKWLWTGEYTRFDIAGTKGEAEHGSRASLVIKTPGFLVYPINPWTDASALLSPDDRRLLDSQQHTETYAVSTRCLLDFLSTAFSATEPALLVSALLKHGKSVTLPYTDASGPPLFVLEGPTKYLEVQVQQAGKSGEKLPCLLCGEHIKASDFRGHAGKHILRAHVGQVENNPPLVVQVSLCLHLSIYKAQIRTLTVRLICKVHLVDAVGEAGHVTYP